MTYFERDGLKYGYQTNESTTLRYANAKPLEFVDVSDSVKVLALAGMPDLQTVPAGKFSATSFAISTPVFTQRYIHSAIDQNTAASLDTNQGPSSSDLAAFSTNAIGAVGGGTGAAGAAGLLLLGSNTGGPDPRTKFSGSICYRGVNEQLDLNQAYLECFNQTVDDLRKALGAKSTVEILKEKYVTISGHVSSKENEEQPVSIVLSITNSMYAPGFAPADRGGYKSNIFITFFNRYAVESSTATMEDIAAALRTVKSIDHSYWLATEMDYQKRKNHPPIGVY
ncbi:hypothetical protein [Stutzerimonas kirkiae]|uniref:hypothetical protein n=1 Tax=Stutzerimonas kirkiae TaxID=2211392 RepID=UPI001037A345|nr:hypothetical protein [Stutzerimonas kirkiae]